MQLPGLPVVAGQKTLLRLAITVMSSLKVRRKARGNCDVRSEPSVQSLDLWTGRSHSSSLLKQWSQCNQYALHRLQLFASKSRCQRPWFGEFCIFLSKSYFISRWATLTVVRFLILDDYSQVATVTPPSKNLMAQSAAKATRCVGQVCCRCLTDLLISVP